MNILKVRIDNLYKKEIMEKIRGFLDEPKFHQIATINPEFVLEAQKNSEFRNILNSCDLSVADGAGIWFAFLRFGKILKARITGADLMLEILKIANQKKMSVFLACKKDGLSTFEEVRIAIQKIYPNLEILGVNIDCHAEFISASREILNQVQDDTILFCNFGAPYQEIFINSQKCDSIRLAMGVGGSFDFLTGKTLRAPVFMRLIGLEWLWRLFQPQEWKFKKERIRRIFRAVVIFPIKIISKK